MMFAFDGGNYIAFIDSNIGVFKEFSGNIRKVIGYCTFKRKGLHLLTRDRVLEQRLHVRVAIQL
mgnify:CR=1 FL=1